MEGPINCCEEAGSFEFRAAGWFLKYDISGEQFGLKDSAPCFKFGNNQGTDLFIYIYKYIHIYILTK